ncbi:hypothetical protein PAEPH01_2067 [Pancytospora epiphaga]|nr:hypothetical protein PAEPH01_2067 [Pancytospora epiphaga]
MVAQRCQICHASEMLEIKDSLYCEACCVYYAMSNGVQRPISLPLKETPQIALELCNKCVGKHLGKQHKILCRSFSEYISSLSYCKKCTVVNSDFIKNQYYKNFIQYRGEHRLFGLLLSFILFIVVMFTYNSNFILPLLMFYVNYHTCSLSIVKGMLIVFLTCNFYDYQIYKDLSLLYCFYRILFTKAVYFNMPADLTSHLDLHSLLCRLNINNSGNRLSK